MTFRKYHTPYFGAPIGATSFEKDYIMTTLKTTLTRLTLACALVAGFAVAAPALDTSAPVANNHKQLSMPLGDYGDPGIRDMPVVR